MVTGNEWTTGNERAKEILKKLGFENIQIYPKKSNCPFDIYAEKDNRIYLIELIYTVKEVYYNYHGMPYARPSRLYKLTKGTDRIPMVLYINDMHNEYVFLRFDFSTSKIARPIVLDNLAEIDKWIKEQKQRGGVDP